jgi:hypothetical protein
LGVLATGSNLHDLDGFGRIRGQDYEERRPAPVSSIEDNRAGRLVATGGSRIFKMTGRQPERDCRGSSG